MRKHWRVTPPRLRTGKCPLKRNEGGRHAQDDSAQRRHRAHRRYHRRPRPGAEPRGGIMIRIRKGSCGTTLRDVSRGTNRRSPLVIGLVNNMPDGALQATERQFCDLLAEAAGSLLIFVRFFSMPELRRSEAGRAYVSQRYEDIGAMLTDRLDGLIVTGAEPRAAELSDEP